MISPLINNLRARKSTENSYAELLEQVQIFRPAFFMTDAEKTGPAHPTRVQPKRQKSARATLNNRAPRSTIFTLVASWPNFVKVSLKNEAL